MAAKPLPCCDSSPKKGRQFSYSRGPSRASTTPLIAPAKYVAMYDPASIPLPPAPPESLVNTTTPNGPGAGIDIFTLRQPLAAAGRMTIAAYYAC